MREIVPIFSANARSESLSLSRRTFTIVPSGFSSSTAPFSTDRNSASVRKRPVLSVHSRANTLVATQHDNNGRKQILQNMARSPLLLGGTGEDAALFHVWIGIITKSKGIKRGKIA